MCGEKESVWEEKSANSTWLVRKRGQVDLNERINFLVTVERTIVPGP